MLRKHCHKGSNIFFNYFYIKLATIFLINNSILSMQSVENIKCKRYNKRKRANVL